MIILKVMKVHLEIIAMEKEKAFYNFLCLCLFLKAT